MGAVMTLETVEASVPQEVGRLRATYRKRGWTVWHGNATGQYWAAHTGRMVMLSGDTAQELAAEIERTQPGRPVEAVPTQARRRHTELVLLLKPRPCVSRGRADTTAGGRR
ncbi:hypothetical protein HGB46_14925 [Nocardiopsis dassonvillei]|uniref:DUF5678 domain-containing protein n=2 Tax=Nocardiopsidaceae TaxID=83676 RepID=D7AWI3_NOCDD|nr:hypothetical protein [Nocardiopsis dassonvillei]ADH65949.1 hypothetical protein Ndas_0502 [Nocardiopsis dassonvillei subsp. dassonvillei DSM 43111]APC34278.1 hypothetical protein A9R04_06040 [Nocardiopsis dassonvillei]NKY79855.1 hypothetical protein [Nocardiopsis dassonvillei]VEI91970.1 Uncharacterised protein [Nocardiopsis dassonvillei]